MINIVVVGANGYIGSSIVSTALSSPERFGMVLAVSRSELALYSQEFPGIWRKHLMPSICAARAIVRSASFYVYYSVSSVTPSLNLSDQEHDTFSDELDTLEKLVDDLSGLISIEYFFLLSSIGALYSHYFNDNAISESTPFLTSSLYGRITYAKEEALARLASKFNFHYTCIRVTNVFGGELQLARQQGLVNRLIVNSLSGSQTNIFVDLKMKREYVRLDDLSDCLLCLSGNSAFQLVRPRILVLSSSRLVTIDSIVRQISERLLVYYDLTLKCTVSSPVSSLPLIQATSTVLLSRFVPSLPRGFDPVYATKALRQMTRPS